MQRFAVCGVEFRAEELRGFRVSGEGSDFRV